MHGIKEYGGKAERLHSFSTSAIQTMKSPSHSGRFTSEVKYETVCVPDPVSKLILEL
jgi:hypothetical protein